VKRAFKTSSPNMGEVREGEAAFQWQTIFARFPHPSPPPYWGRGHESRLRAISLALVATVLALPAQAQDVLTETRVTQFGAWQDTASATLIIDGSTDTEVFAPVLEAFAKRVPDVAIRYREITTNELYQLAESGCSGNAPAADLVVSSSIDQQVKLANDGCAQPNHIELGKLL